MPAELKEVPIHPSKRLASPGGGQVDIDLAMIPLMRALWACGMRTLGCCQDLGESIEKNGHGSPVPARDRQRHADFYKGRAWLKMPMPDANQLIAILGADPVFASRVRRWTHPEAWQCTVYIFPTDDGHARPADAAQINFPTEQIDEVTALLTSKRRTGDEP